MRFTTDLTDKSYFFVNIENIIEKKLTTWRQQATVYFTERI